ncbi:MAG: tol-pal system protein YbgF [Desulfovibrio sp.]|nr:tol-pal system protein YbgF [Desulfovibrio sp.]
MRTFRSLCLLTLTATVPLTGCMASNDGLRLEEQVQQQDMQLRQLQPAQADAWNQIQALRQEVNALKGQLDDLQNAGGARNLASRLKTHDEALRQVERSMALNLNLGDPLTSTARQASSATSPEATPTYGQAPVASVSPATAAGQGYGSTAPKSSQSSTAPSASTWGQATPQAKPQVQKPQKDISLALFDAGVNAYNARKYTEAQRSFSDFLKNYKSHSQVPEAHYYLAECYFQRNQFADAALEYDTVIKKYPSSSSAPGAYLKQAISFSKLNQSAAAKARMQELIKKYPNAPEAGRAKAFLKNNK